jgi:Leucine-rich repeat (LRR) protein
MSLTTLVLNNNALSSLDATTFSDLASLTYLDLSFNTLNGTLPATIFSNLNKLQTLYLNNNQLRSIASTTFAGLTSLTFLSLSNNQLASIDPVLFNGLVNLQQLWITRNNLTNLAPTQFNGLNSLEQLYLQYNQFKTFPQNLLMNVGALTTVNVGNNPLTATVTKSYLGLNPSTSLLGNYASG